VEKMKLDIIYNEDCLEGMKRLSDNSIDLILTDPPFKVSQRYAGGVDADNLMAVSSIRLAIPELSRILKPNRFMVMFYDNRILPFLFEIIKKTEFVYRKQIFLYRRWGNAHRWVGWMQCTDPICFFVNGWDKPFAPKIKGKVKHDCYIKTGPEEINSGHPAQKPLEIIEDIVTWCSDERQIVLDPYIGSGTTAIACKRLNRHYIGFETNPDYCEMAKRRLENERTLWDSENK